MPAPVADRAQHDPWRILDALATVAGVIVVAIVLRHSMIVMPLKIANAFALDNPALITVQDREFGNLPAEASAAP